MTLDDRAAIFGQPSDTLAPEAAWIFKDDNGDWPIWDEAIDALMSLAEVDRDEAEARILEAIRTGELEPKLRAGGGGWGVEVPERLAARIVRRYMDVTLERRDREDQLP